MNNVLESTGQPRVATKKLAQISFAGAFGTLLEYYDFFLVTFAATLVWPTVFFRGMSPALATALGLLTLGIFYVSRPIGAFVFGHYGDRLGRKSILVWTLIIMGTGSLAIAALPPYAAIGIWAAIILLVVRVVQGIGFGGEFGGASTWVSESADTRKRGFWTVWQQMAGPAGSFLASTSFSLVILLSNEAYLIAWGWRILFVIGAVVAAMGVILRYKLSDSLLFEDLKKQNKTERVPSLRVLKEQRLKILFLALIMVSTIYGTTLQPFVVTFLKAEKTPFLLITTISAYSSGVAILGDFIGGLMGDIVRRKWIVAISTMLGAVGIYPFFLALKSLNPTLIVLGPILMFVFAGIGYGNLAALFPEQFSIKYRYSGSGISFGFGALIAGIIVSAIYPILIAASHGVSNAWPYVAAVYLIISVGGFLSAIFLKEKKITLAQ